jgi:hypothetical protein
MPETRLGDIIDDYCSRCRLLTDHSVVAIVGDAVRKVRCRTCQYEHEYRRGKSGKKSKPSVFEQVLASIGPLPPPPPPAPTKPKRTRKTRG